MPERATDKDADLLAELGVKVEVEQAGGRTPREQRIIAGFEEIERFVDEHRHPPEHGEVLDIFERIYAVRLDQIRASEECHAVLMGSDRHGLLTVAAAGPALDGIEQANDDELLATLGIKPVAAAGADVSNLVHVRSHTDRMAAEDVARRAPCSDFDTFRPVFEQVQQDLAAGLRQTAKYERRDKDADGLNPGDLFIIGGQKALIASEGESVDKPLFPGDRRLRVIFDNGTEANLWLRSLKRALYEEGNRKILPLGVDTAPLFSDQFEDGDLSAGYIYVLQSKSDEPFVAEHRSLIHKIGVTGGDVKARVANAKKDPTYLLADVDIVAVYKLANVNRKALENLIHRVFDGARLDLQLKDRFGSKVEPREWFLVSLPAIEDAIARIMDGSIADFRYDGSTGRLQCENTHG